MPWGDHETVCTTSGRSKDRSSRPAILTASAPPVKYRQLQTDEPQAPSRNGAANDDSYCIHWPFLPQHIGVEVAKPHNIWPPSDQCGYSQTIVSRVEPRTGPGNDPY